MKIKQVIILVFLLLSNLSYAQQKVWGVIYEQNTNKPLSNCNVSVEKGRGKTISNEEGKFELTVGKSEKKLLISHIGYQKISVEIGSGNGLGIYLDPVSIPLKGVVVGNPALAYLNAALQKSAADSLIRKYFKGYLRSTLTEDSKLKSFNEILFDAEWGSKGITKWKPNQNRYAIEDDALYKSQSIFNFFSSFVKTGTMIKSKVLPNSLDSDKKKYEFRIVKTYPLADRGEAVEILCTPKVRKKPFFEGRITINTTTDNILKVEGTYYQEKSGQNIAKNQTYEYEVNFSEKPSGELIFDHFRMTTKAKVKLNTIVENTLIYKIEEYSTGVKGLMSVKKNQFNLMNKAYEETFWAANQVVKYTSLQQNLIDNFNQKRKFISNFLK